MNSTQGLRAVSTAQKIIAASPFCFAGFDPWVAYQYLQKAGLSYVEVPAFPPSISVKHGVTTFSPEAMDRRDAKAFLNRLSEMGLKPITVAAMCHLDDAREVEALRRRIDFARDLGCTYVITDSCEEIDLGSRRSKIINTLRWLGDYASDYNIRIALETHAGPTQNGKAARYFLEEVAHPNIGYNYDTGNIFYYNEGVDLSDDLQAIAGHIMHVHLKDTQGGKGEWKFCALGEGYVNFRQVVEILEATGFNGPYSLEMEGMQDEDLNREEYFQRVMKSLDYLRSIGLGKSNPAL